MKNEEIQINKSFNKSVEDLMNSIHLLIENKYITPALILFYSGIDSYSWLFERKIERQKNTQARFLSYVNKWYNVDDLPCTTQELYAARNALIHRQTTESTLSEKGRVKRLFYGINDSDVERLNLMLVEKDMKDIIAISITNLLKELKLSIGRAYLDVLKEDNWKKEFDEKTKQLLQFSKAINQ